MRILYYLQHEWQRSPNPGWLKAALAILALAGIAVLLAPLAQAVREQLRKRRLRKIKQATRAEYDALIAKMRKENECHDRQAAKKAAQR